MNDYTYQVEIIDEVKASSPGAALQCFLSRIQEEETLAHVEHLKSGERYYVVLGAKGQADEERHVQWHMVEEVDDGE